MGGIGSGRYGGAGRTTVEECRYRGNVWNVTREYTHRNA